MSTTLQLLVLGTGCTKCSQLYTATEQAAKELGAPYELIKVSDLRQIMALRVMTTPALVVNGSVKITGPVPGKEELLGILKAANA